MGEMVIRLDSGSPAQQQKILKDLAKLRDPDEDAERIELLVRIEVSTEYVQPSLPECVVGPPLRFHKEPSYWRRESATDDAEIGVSYAVYSTIVSQVVDGFSPDMDKLADIISTCFEVPLEDVTGLRFAYEKRIHLITHPIAVWNSASGKDDE